MNQFFMLKRAYAVSQPNTAVIEFPIPCHEGSMVYMNYMTNIGSLIQQYPSVHITDTGGIYQPKISNQCLPIIIMS